MLYEKIREYTKSETYPMHMPGHKGIQNPLTPGLPFDLDITEIHGFDDLHNPEGILLEISALSEKLYGSSKTFPLINGSTVGILAAIGAHTKRGDKILIAKNNHWSVDNSAELFGLEPIYILPKIDDLTGVAFSISPDAIEDSLNKHPEIKLIIVTSPSYEGVVSDLSTIADIAHAHNIPLAVDSAHGAHLGFSETFPSSAVKSGADIVIMSLHKTLPALTQCSLLHLCTDRANTAETKRLLSILQTSSPSYVLMASIDRCLRLLDTQSEILFEKYLQNLISFDKQIMGLKSLSVLCHGADADNLHDNFFDYDPGKIVISTKKAAISGLELMDILRFEHKIELERAAQDYVIAMTSICDTPEGFGRLAKALVAIDQRVLSINN